VEDRSTDPPSLRLHKIVPVMHDASGAAGMNFAIKTLSGAMLQSPEQFGWVVNFQREQFKKSLSEKHRARYDEFLGHVIDRNFRDQPGSGPAFAQMTAQFFAELDLNAKRIQMMEARGIPAKVIWGENDPYTPGAITSFSR
jgi:pimeloyl-ACP methyl ester carboxylesterase